MGEVARRAGPFRRRRKRRKAENEPEMLQPHRPQMELAELIAWHCANGTLGQLFAEFPELSL
jgi:hypothetical protein